MTASGVKGRVNGVTTIQGGAKLVQLQVANSYSGVVEPVVLFVDGAGIATTATSVIQEGIAGNSSSDSWRNIQNAVSHLGETANSQKLGKTWRQQVELDQQNIRQRHIIL